VGHPTRLSQHFAKAKGKLQLNPPSMQLTDRAMVLARPSDSRVSTCRTFVKRPYQLMWQGGEEIGHVVGSSLAAQAQLAFLVFIGRELFKGGGREEDPAPAHQ